MNTQSRIKTAHNNLLTTSSQRKTESRSSLSSCQIVFKGKIFYTDEKKQLAAFRIKSIETVVHYRVCHFVRRYGWCWLIVLL